MLIQFTLSAIVGDITYIPITSSKVTRDSITDSFLDNLYELADKHFCSSKGTIDKIYFIDQIKACLNSTRGSITFDEPNTMLTVQIEFIDDITQFDDVVWRPVVFP